VTAEKIKQLAEETELKLQGGASPRPLLSVPHILCDEASCYYHGYVLAEMSVHQTRDHFLGKYSVIVDNPKVGEDLANVYWKPGNSEAFLDLVQALTGKPLTGEAWVSALGKDLTKLIEEEEVDYGKALEAVKAKPFADTDAIDLEQHMRIVDGDKILADSSEGKNGSFLGACKAFEKEVQSLIAKSSL